MEMDQNIAFWPFLPILGRLLVVEGHFQCSDIVREILKDVPQHVQLSGLIAFYHMHRSPALSCSQ